MSLVLIMAKLTPQAMQAWHEQGVTKRAADVSAMMESIGGSVVSYYAADGGEWDNVGVFQFPDDWSHAAMIRFLAQGLQRWR
ncbi:MAG: GYD domain-containing protein, partial [Acidimicrobiia bacterium]|nr:GYD domain-containing protein [Acidimicrobiia bacterium]